MSGKPTNSTQANTAANAPSSLRRVGGLIDARPGVSAALLLSTAAKTAPAYLAPVYIAEVVRIFSVDEPADIRWFMLVSLGFALLVLTNPLMTVITERLVSGRTRAMERRLRSMVVSRLQELSMAFHSESPTGLLQAKVLTDVQAVVMLVGQIFRRGVETGLGLVVALIIVAANDWRILIFFVLSVPLAVLLLKFFRGTMMRRNRAHRRSVEEMSARIGEMINLIPVTRAHGVESHEIETVEHHLANVHRSASRVDLINGWFSACSWVTLHLFGLSLVVGSGWLVHRGHMTIDKLLLYHGLYWLTVANLEKMLQMTPIFSKGFEAVASLGEILDSPEVEDSGGAVELDLVRGDIDFDQVTFVYEGGLKPAVRDFSLQVHAGECIALVGESGSGKSTLMNLLIGFWHPTHGEIRLDGHAQRDLDMRAWRRHVAVVPQHTVLFSSTLRDNIVYGLPDVPESEIRQAIEAANLTDIVENLPAGLDTMLGENGLKLSGGQRQRVAIARAIIRDPRVIIFDEATSALDVASERAVQRAIDQLIGGRTTFIIAHRLTTIRRADRVVVMRNGECIESGRLDELRDTVDSAFAGMEALQQA